ncbi:V-set and immunoglobulin domain-containing protein 10-like isoform X2 [Puntigrus tetrazona]|uniref:V-set and immunoglobulin domain-containing protein 10-like isoform X2 n=1 Tax=Puntigrus tetrazona TaxID=1606681 RepID=UPI001C89C0D6|nr:V-set and immunoglobulin domain-containing protein 10-like isoform X2 [Puntigrus tetrazona]
MQTPFGLVYVLLLFVTGSVCYLSILPKAPVSVEALVGQNVTLGVSHAGVPQPEVMWFKGSLLVARWTVGNGSLSGVASGVFKPELNGSLTFMNVPLGYNGTYTVEMNHIGEEKVSATFNLFVYDVITNVSLRSDPGDAVEGEARFTLYYSTLQGEAKEVRWFFNGLQLRNGSRYSIGGKNLTVNQLGRNDTGRYAASLSNPFSSETQGRNITVLYGPDRPVLKVSPTKALFVSGESLSLSCQAEGEPPPSATWFFNGESVAPSSTGTVVLSDVKTSQSGIYTCVMINTRTEVTLQRNISVIVYEPPGGEPLCSVRAVNGDAAALQFLCLWPGGAPEARVSFPGLSVNASGYGNYSVTVNDIQSLNGREIICEAEHPLIRTQCSVIPRGPVDFLPVILTSVSQDEQTMVVIRCSAEATPQALVQWIKNGHRLQTGPKYQISTNTTRLIIYGFNVTADLDTYTCAAINPLGNKTVDTTLLGPQISNSSVSLSINRTEVTLSWVVPLTSVITGFDIQMKGPEISSPSQPKLGIASDFLTVQSEPASARSSTLSGLNPESTYYFRIVPKAGRTAGEQSEQHRIGPAAGLSGAAIAGIAAGIPCALLLILIVLAFIYCGRRDRIPRYPVSRATEKAVISQSALNPHRLLRARLKPPPAYRLQQPERSSPLPSENSCARMATTV